MKLVRYGAPGAEKAGLIDADGVMRDLSGHLTDVTGDALGDMALAKLRALDVGALPVVEGEPRLGPCVGSIGKFMC
ncbi:MAG: 2-hydroxyhepta-2,4-diene-1,7-dioate isomerase, partial [Rhodobacteraceae bacterium]|nr:2-hydroxyhepta-2,4-diene-1,7-dioate isomerase [Paracoccaceae bacterium]